MIKRFFIAIFFFTLGTGVTLGQLDSLREVVESTTEWDDEAFEALDQLTSGVTRVNLDSAHILAEWGLDLAKEHNNRFYQAQFYRRLGIAVAEKGDLSSTIQNFLRSVEIFEELGDSIQVGGMYLNIGVVYSRIGNRDKAIDFYLKGLKFGNEDDEPRQMSVAKNNIAFLMLAKERYAEAEIYAKDAQRLALLSEDSSAYFSTYSVLAQVKIAKGEIIEGTKYYEEFLDYSERQGRLDQVSKTSQSYGQILLNNLDRPKEALEQCQRSYKLASRMGMLAESARACECMSTAFERLGHLDSSLFYLKEGVALFDSLEENSSASKVESMVLNYDQAKKTYSDSLQRAKEKEISAAKLKFQEQKYQDEKLQNYFLIGGIGLLAILVLLVFNAYRGKKNANQLITAQKEEIEDTRKKTLESINYADRIQRAFLPEPEELRNHFKDSFIYYKPRDIVSGDFYWFEKIGDKVVLACADCTGHGVPGGFLSIVGHALMNQTVREKGELDPGKILTSVHEGIKDSLGREGGADMQEGMDISIVVIDQKENLLHFSGAGLGIYLARDSGVDYLKPSPLSLGGITLRPGRKVDREYITETIPINDGGWFYMFSDGYVDQFGGPKEEKYNLKRFKENIEKHKGLPGIEQKRKFVDSLLSWQGSARQNDDILLIGVRV